MTRPRQHARLGQPGPARHLERGHVRSGRGRGGPTVLAALLLVASLHAFATPTVRLDLDDRLERSVDVFVADVSAIRGAPIGVDAWTIVTLEVRHWLRSGGIDVAESEVERVRRPIVELAFLGGDAPGVPRQTVAGMPTLVVGERVLLLSYGAEARYASPLVGYDQGLFRIVDDAWTDADGRTLGFDAAGILTLGALAAPVGDELLDALAQRLEGLGGRP
jgi:hypothetical protein